MCLPLELDDDTSSQTRYRRPAMGGVMTLLGIPAFGRVNR
jgi:hypothetical protein